MIYINHQYKLLIFLNKYSKRQNFKGIILVIYKNQYFLKIYFFLKKYFINQ